MEHTKMNFDVITEIFENDEDDCLIYQDIHDNPEWKKFLSDCAEWATEVYETSDVFEEVYGPFKQLKTRKPCNIINKSLEYDYEMILIGKTIVRRNGEKKKSFKYNIYGMNKNIFCKTVLVSKSDDVKKICKCKMPHSFKEIPYCNSNCKKITYENNFYTGNCNKRHFKETVHNFVFRNNIILKESDNACFDFYEIPSVEFIQNLLNKCKKLKFKEVKVKIVPKPKTFTEFMNDHKKSSNTSSDYTLTDDDFEKAWSI